VLLVGGLVWRDGGSVRRRDIDATCLSEVASRTGCTYRVSPSFSHTTTVGAVGPPPGLNVLLWRD